MIGPREAVTQRRVVEFFQNSLEYSYLGDWEERGGENVEELLLRDWLLKQGHDEQIVKKAIQELSEGEGCRRRALALRCEPRGVPAPPLWREGKTGGGRPTRHCPLYRLEVRREERVRHR